MCTHILFLMQARLNLLVNGASPQPVLLSSLFAFVPRAVGAGVLVSDGLLQEVAAYLSYAMPSLELKVDQWWCWLVQVIVAPCSSMLPLKLMSSAQQW